MQKMTHIISQIREKILQYKLHYFFLGFVVFSLVGGGYYFYKDSIGNILSKNFSIFEVSGGNFDLGMKKIPYNTKTIDITFSKELDETSISKEVFKISPEVPGIVTLKDANTISYELSEKLTIGQDYSIILSKNIRSFIGESLENDILYIVSATPGAKVVQIIPEGKIVDLSKNIAVFFSIPMVSLTELDKKDALECPLELQPKVAGKCSWTTTSVLEFIPEKTFAGATEYQYTISSKPGMNYELENTSTGSFFTPELEVFVSETFVPKDFITLSFNYPVSKEELQKYLSVFQPNKKDISASNGEELKVEIQPFQKSENTFIIKPVEGNFTYSTPYDIKIKQGLMPKYGNIAFKGLEKQIFSTSFVSGVSPYKNVFSQTGALINTKYLSAPIATKDMFFQVQFYEEIQLNKNLISFKHQKTGEGIPFDIEYGKKIIYENNTSKEEIDKHSLKITLKKDLDFDSFYDLSILKSANSSLLSDVVYTYQTAQKGKINDFVFIDYSKSCLYVNNELDDLTDESLYSWDEGYYSKAKQFVSISSSGIVKSFSPGEYIGDWNFEQSLKNLSFEQKNKKLIERGYCPEAKQGEKLYVIQTRLHPNMSYEIVLSKLKDMYGYTFEKDFKKTIQTGDLKEIDKYVYSSLPHHINVFPSHVPIVLNIQSINTSKAAIEVCLLNNDGYIDYLANRYVVTDYTPKCQKNIFKEIDTKLSYWKLISNKYDLETDILGEKISTPYALFTLYSNIDKKKATSKATHVIAKTNLSLFLEKAQNKSLLFATDIQTHNEVGNLKLDFYNYAGSKTTIKYTFDKNKKVYVIDDSLQSISYIQASSNDYVGVIGENDAFSNYDFKYISGQDSSTKDFAYVYSDRPIYRPGDEVFIKGILREFQFDGYKKSKITSGILKIIADDWSTYKTIEVKVDKNSNFTGSFLIPKDSNLGNFRFQFTYRPDNITYDYEVYTYGGMSIEQYRKPTFKVNLETQKSDVLLGEKTNILVQPVYYFGGKMTGVPGKYSILTQNYFFDSKGYSDFQFGQGNQYFDCMYWGYCNYSDSVMGGSQDFLVNENGEYSFDYTFSSSGADAEKIYTFNIDITDPDTGRTVSNSVSKVLHITDGYAGLKANYYNSLKKGIYMDIVTLDYEAKEMPYKPVQVEVIRKDFKQTRKLGVDGVFYNEYAVEDIKESTFQLITDEKGRVKYNAKTKQDGQYEVKLHYTGKNNQTFTSSQIVYVAGDDYVSWGNDNNTVTDLEADKITYKLGETATFTLKSPVNNGKVLYVLEKDDGILDSVLHTLSSYTDRLEIKLNDKHYPNVYVKAYLIGSQENNPLPVYKRALGVVKVLTDYKKLNVSIITPKKNYTPGESVDVMIEVTDATGKVVPNANGSLSVVDESVLALKGNPRKNPYSFFYDMKRYLGVVSYTNLKYLIEKLEVKDVSGGEKGGAGDSVKGGETKKPRGIFKDTAYWVSDFTTDEKGKAHLSLGKLPDNLTTWVLEALVSTPVDNKIGIQYETIFTSQEVMIEDNLPRYLSAGDRIVFSPVVYNRTGKDEQFKVSLQATNGILQSIDKTVLIPSGGSLKVPFIFDVKPNQELQNFEISQIHITAQALSQSEKSDSIIKKLPIYLSTVPEYVATTGKTTGVSHDEKISLSDPKGSSLTVNYSATLFSYLLDGIDYLSAYPYGCAEQRTSAIMPNIYVKQLYLSAGKNFDLKTKMIQKYIDNEIGYKEISVDEAIQDYLIEIKKFQNTDGGFVYWYDSNYMVSDVGLTQYIFASLSKLKHIGYKPDEKMISKAKEFLKHNFYNLKTCDENTFHSCLSVGVKSQIIEAFLVANPNDYDAYKMYQTLPTKKLSGLQQISLLSQISQIESLGKTVSEDIQNQLQKHFNTFLSQALIINPRGAFISGDDYSRLYNTAWLLKSIAYYGKEKLISYDAVIDQMIRFITQSKTFNGFGSTYDNSFIIEALAVYISKAENIKYTSLQAELSFNSENLQTKTINAKNIFEVSQVRIDSNKIAKENIFNIQSRGTGSLYYDISMKYFLPSKNLKPRDEGFYVEQKYFSRDEYNKVETLKHQEYEKYLSGEIVYEQLQYPRDVIEYLTPIHSGKIGDLVLVYHKIITNEHRDQVAIESFIPAGSEIVNTALATESKIITDIATNIPLDRREIRDNMYFGWASSLYSGIYDFSYTIRLTHSGEFQVKPTQVSEFYTPEVFGRSSGKEFSVE